ncbi:MAG TPA: hypothetical protein VMD58_06090 [Acidobacteriaceae bacterium]|nr:hypothetical protein [Acidobacteriaceae bacterium]
MTPLALSRHGPSLMMIEGCLTAIAVAIAFAFPTLGSRIFTRAERVFARLARKRRLCVVIAGVAAFLLRLAILPFCPVPHPFIQDDFSFLLAADTFAHGRLANPTPAMWTHFETLLVSMKPTYQSVYFPAQGLVLAAGKLLTGHPWFGLLFVTALMCSALCWALQGWLPPAWALLGTTIAIVRLALFSCWINTYSGAGSVTTLGGALALGALPRFMKHLRLRDGLLMALGVVLLGISRPYEGALLCIPIAVLLFRWAFFGKNRPPTAVLLQRMAIPCLLILAGVAWMGYYNYRVFGSPFTPPYKLNRAEYAMAPYFLWQPLRPRPVYRHKLLEEYYTRVEMNTYRQVHSVRNFLPDLFIRYGRVLYFYAGALLLPPLFMLRRVLLDRRVRFLVLCILILIAGTSMEIFFIPYYLGVFVAVFYVLGVQAMRHLRLWRPADNPVGLALVRFTVALCLLLGVVRVFAAPLHIRLAQNKGGEWAAEWYGPGPSGTARVRVADQLDQMPGGQLAIVHYSPDHDPTDEWVYNAADINDSKVIWARDMGSAQNLDLIHYYKNRTVWLVQPDKSPVSVTPYAMPAPPPAASAHQPQISNAR